jgi:TolA-binding protein
MMSGATLCFSSLTVGIMRQFSMVKVGLIASIALFIHPVNAIEIEDVSKDSPQLQIHKLRQSNAQLHEMIEGLIRDVSQLRGEIESHTYRIENLEKNDASVTRQQDVLMKEVAPIALDVQLKSSQLYDNAFELLSAKHYDKASQVFEEYIAKYSNGTYIVNSYYWLGEIASLQNNNQRAIGFFEKITTLHPSDAKSVEAYFKLAQLYHSQGNTDQVNAFLKKVTASSELKDDLAERVAQFKRQYNYP